MNNRLERESCLTVSNVEGLRNINTNIMSSIVNCVRLTAYLCISNLTTVNYVSTVNGSVVSGRTIAANRMDLIIMIIVRRAIYRRGLTICVARIGN